MCNLPVAPLTQLQTIHECHERSSSLTIDCNIGHRIRILESFYGATSEPNRDYCSEGYRTKDCKSHTSFQNACNGRSSCTVHFFRVYLPDCNANSNYLTVQYECVPERKVHGVCTNVEDISTWGTLRTTDFPHSYGFNEDCWCKLSADNNQRIVLSVISFQLFPYDPTCSETGLYLQSERNRSKDCTFLQQGHYYISSSKNLYLNFYSRKPTIRAGFWIIYEASDAKSRIRLKCGDTDEVRPALFTRFSTKKELNLTPYIYEFASSTTPGLGLQTITAKVPKTNLQLTTTFNKYNLISQGTKNYSNFFNTTPKSRHYFTTKMRLRLSTRKILTKKIITTSKMSSKTTTLKKTSTTTKTTTTTTTTTTTATTTTNTTPATTTTTTFTTTSTTSSKMTRKTKKTTTLKQIFTSEYLQTVTSEQKSTRLLRPKIDPTIDEFILSTSPQIPTTNIQLSDFVLEKINFDRINLTTEKADVENITKSDLVFNQSDFMVAFGIQEKNAFEKSPKVQTGKLSKTELTIVISCVIFIAMLTVVNLIIYSFKRLAKKQVPTAKIIEPGLNAADPDKKSYDILPGVGEIVLWADNDKRGYLIDINGSWAKIDGQRWIRDNMTVLHNTYKKASMAYRNKFKKKDDKKEPNDDSRLIKRIPPTIGSYALTPVPEAIEYDQSENNSRSSIREFGNFGESDYHIEHGQITSLGKRNKILCHQASLTNYSLENNSESNHLNEPNGSKHNDSWDSKEDKQDSKLELESQTNILALGDSTDSSPSFDHKLAKEDNILNKENPSNKDPSLGSNNSSIRLDNQSLKYSNQSNIPIAIVAPNKSNSSTLETKHHKKEENE
ncbi:hypothetical protein BpHYR1_001690 [Brachionus plicatilis]|uniref:CUB domain-containing protein n=1 Tax=Brachionus plicatilis TaxID=10195 RepID=A0A3M7T001_BRAPC|nr:hypothetical protein BpHYR1_001690 [Brachionus plicatilis]